MRNELQTGTGNAGTVMLVVAASVPYLVPRILFSYLRAKRRAKAASKKFLEALVKGGVPKQEAKSLAKVYSSSLSIRKMMKNYGFSGTAGRLVK